eukprot:2323409-Heterocapsa_arctica.AAC.1
MAVDKIRKRGRLGHDDCCRLVHFKGKSRSETLRGSQRHCQPRVTELALNKHKHIIQYMHDNAIQGIL